MNVRNGVFDDQDPISEAIDDCDKILKNTNKEISNIAKAD